MAPSSFTLAASTDSTVKAAGLKVKMRERERVRFYRVAKAPVKPDTHPTPYTQLGSKAAHGRKQDTLIQVDTMALLWSAFKPENGKGDATV